MNRHPFALRHGASSTPWSCRGEADRRQCRRLVLLGLLSFLSTPPALAVTPKTFDLRWNPFDGSQGEAITGQITLDMDQVPGVLPYDNPAAMPNWVLSLTIQAPGSAPYGGTFTRADYSGISWSNLGPSGLIGLDFTSNLVGAPGGWGGSCPFVSGSCNFQLHTSAGSGGTTPYADAPFQMTTLNTTTQQRYYLGLTEFTPASEAAAAAPGPLPLLGAAAALHWSRRLRRRIGAPH